MILRVEVDSAYVRRIQIFEDGGKIEGNVTWEEEEWEEEDEVKKKWRQTVDLL